MVKKYNITIKDTLHTNKESLIAMILATTRMRRKLDEEKILRGQEPKKKLARRADTLKNF